MSIWLLLLAVAVVVGAWWILKKDPTSVDAAVNEVKEEVKDALDVNNDGKVNVEDAKVAVEVVKTKAKATATKAKATATKAKATAMKATTKAVGSAKAKSTSTKVK